MWIASNWWRIWKNLCFIPDPSSCVLCSIPDLCMFLLMSTMLIWNTFAAAEGGDLGDVSLQSILFKVHVHRFRSYRNIFLSGGSKSLLIVKDIFFRLRQQFFLNDLSRQRHHGVL